MNANPAAKKAALRKQLRAKRRAFTAAEYTARSRLAAKAVATLPQFSAGRRVAVYLPFDRETDTADLLVTARRRGVKIYVPVVVDRRHRRIAFYRLAGGTRRGVFGIQVPRKTGRPLAARWFDLLVVPLVGVDAAGRRLGMGGGFYDSATAFRTQRRHWRGPLMVGFAFDCQRVPSTYAEHWDLGFDAIATETGIHSYRQGALA
jgi:5-formyltetrahydrofolate cyclo-ligase